MIGAMSTPGAPLVGLWSHRWGDLRRRTGVGRYALELSTALGELPGPLRYERRGGQEPQDDGGSPPLRRSWPPRQALHAAWLATGRPRLERVAEPFDLLHVLFPSFPVPTAAPVVGTIHDVMVLDHPQWYGRTERRSVTAATRRLADGADRIITGTEHAAGQLVDRLGIERGRIDVVHHGLHPSLHADGPVFRTGRERPYVVAVGAVTERKNLGVVLRAVAASDDLDLVLVGPDGPASPDVARQAEALGIVDRVEHAGRIPDRELAGVLRGALALVHPSLDEGFGLPPLEAMAAGTPALVARSGALPEVVGEAAPALDPHDPDAWAAAIARLRDPDHRAVVAAAGRAHVAGRTWAAAAEATAAIHAEVLRAHGRL